MKTQRIALRHSSLLVATGIAIAGVLFVTPSARAQATQIYVDIRDGNDANSGLNPNVPVQHIYQAIQVANGLSPAPSQVLFQVRARRTIGSPNNVIQYSYLKGETFPLIMKPTYYIKRAADENLPNVKGSTANTPLIISGGDYASITSLNTGSGIKKTLLIEFWAINGGSFSSTAGIEEATIELAGDLTTTPMQGAIDILATATTGNATSSPQIKNCRFVACRLGVNVFAGPQSSTFQAIAAPTVTNCTFTNDTLENTITPPFSSTSAVVHMREEANSSGGSSSPSVGGTISGTTFTTAYDGSTSRNFIASGRGMALYSNDSHCTPTITGCTFDGKSWPNIIKGIDTGIYAFSTGNGEVDAVVSSTVVKGHAYDGIEVFDTRSTVARSVVTDFLVSSCTIAYNGNYVYANHSSTNHVNGNGILARVDDYGTLNITTSDCTNTSSFGGGTGYSDSNRRIRRNGRDGIRVQTAGSNPQIQYIHADIASSRISDNGVYGIEMSATRGNITSEIERNEIFDNSKGGVRNFVVGTPVSLQGNAVAKCTIMNNALFRRGTSPTSGYQQVTGIINERHSSAYKNSYAPMICLFNTIAFHNDTSGGGTGLGIKNYDGFGVHNEDSGYPTRAYATLLYGNDGDTNKSSEWTDNTTLHQVNFCHFSSAGNKFGANATNGDPKWIGGYTSVSLQPNFHLAHSTLASSPVVDTVPSSLQAPLPTTGLVDFDNQSRPIVIKGNALIAIDKGMDEGQ